MRECRANLEPIELLYQDENFFINNLIKKEIGEPDMEVKSWNGINRLWKIDDRKIIENIRKKFSKKILFIADGHHRYQTSINCWKEGGSQYRMAVFVNMDNPGLTILPTHRLLYNIDTGNFLDRAREYFSIKEMDFCSSSHSGKEIVHNLKNKKHSFALYKGGDHYWILTLKDDKAMDEFVDHSKEWRMLDVSIFHSLIIKKILKIKKIADHVKYTRDEKEAIRLVDEGKCQLAFLLNPTKIDEIISVALKGEHLPQKSTYFLPKLLSGLVIYSFR
jgi:uncharacterized protein (DUF1015 family)